MQQISLFVLPNSAEEGESEADSEGTQFSGSDAMTKLDEREVATFCHWETDLQVHYDRCCPGTCEWILLTPEFSSWENSHEPGDLHLVGSAGSGKTIMSAFLINHLRNKYPKERLSAHDPFVLYSFCTLRTQEDVLSSLLRQVLRAIGSWESCGFSEIDPSHHDYITTLMTIFRRIKVPKLFIILDAVDELTDRSGTQLRKRLGTLSGFTTHLKMILTSRPGTQWLPNETVLLVDKFTGMKENIATFVNRKLDSFEKQYMKLRTEQRVTIMSVILPNAESICVAQRMWHAFIGERWYEGQPWSETDVEKGIQEVLRLQVGPT
jgi:hypothetical protein